MLPYQYRKPWTERQNITPLLIINALELCLFSIKSSVCFTLFLSYCMFVPVWVMQSPGRSSSLTCRPSSTRSSSPSCATVRRIRSSGSLTPSSTYAPNTVSTAALNIDKKYGNRIRTSCFLSNTHDRHPARTILQGWSIRCLELVPSLVYVLMY